MAIAIASNDVKWSQWKPPTVTEYPLAATKSNYQLFVQLPWKVGLAFKKTELIRYELLNYRTCAIIIRTYSK